MPGVRRTGTHPPRPDAELAASDGRDRGDRPGRGCAAGVRVREADGRRRRGRRHDADRGRRDHATGRCGTARRLDRDDSDGDDDSAGRPRRARFDGARADRDHHHAREDDHDVEDGDHSGQDDHDAIADHDHANVDDTGHHDHHDTDHVHADDGHDADDSLARLVVAELRASPGLWRVRTASMKGVVSEALEARLRIAPALGGAWRDCARIQHIRATVPRATPRTGRAVRGLP